MRTPGAGMRKLSAVIVLLLAIHAQSFGRDQQPAVSQPGRAESYLYRVTLVQAAPGKLTELIDLYKKKFAADTAAGDEAPLWMRHSQGDHWDLMILQPIGSYAEFLSSDRVARRLKAEQPLASKIRDDIA